MASITNIEEKVNNEQTHSGKLFAEEWNLIINNFKRIINSASGDYTNTGTDELLLALKEHGVKFLYIASGTNTLTLTNVYGETNPEFIEGSGGILFIKPSADNTGNVTIKISGGTTTKQLMLGSGQVPAGYLKANKVYIIEHDLDNNVYKLVTFRAEDSTNLDGYGSAYYRNASNINAGTLSNDRLPNDIVRRSFKTTNDSGNTALLIDNILEFNAVDGNNKSVRHRINAIDNGDGLDIERSYDNGSWTGMLRIQGDNKIRTYNSLGINTIPDGYLANGKGIAFGDGDTGIRESTDGILEFYNNNTLVFRNTSTESRFYKYIRQEYADTNPDVSQIPSFYTIEYSGDASNITNDRVKYGSRINIDSNIVNGNGNEKIYLYGNYVISNTIGDIERNIALVGYARALHDSGTINTLKGTIGIAYSDSSGSVSSSIGIEGQTYIVKKSPSYGVGGFFRALTLTSNDTDSSKLIGIHAEVEHNSDTNNIINARAVEAIIDNNKTSDKILNSSLFYGIYEGSIPTNAYGVNIPSNVQNYFGGTIALNASLYILGDTNVHTWYKDKSGKSKAITYYDSSRVIFINGIYEDDGTTIANKIEILRNKTNFIKDVYVPRLYFESGDHSITTNDGSGNFNIRVGNTPDATPKYTVDKQSAIHTRYMHEGNVYPSLEILFSENAYAANRSAGDNVSFVKSFYLSGDGSIRWGQDKIWHAGNDGSGSGLDADKLDGLQASSFLRSDTNDTLSGEYRFTYTGDVSLTSNGAITIGDDNSINMSIDNNEIQARNNGSASTLILNQSGGNIDCGGPISTAGGSFKAIAVSDTTNAHYWMIRKDGTNSGLFYYDINTDVVVLRKYKLNGIDLGGQIILRDDVITFNRSIGINVIPDGYLANGKGIAFGDGDTGIRQNGDGILEFYNNNTLVFRNTSTESRFYKYIRQEYADTNPDASQTANLITMNISGDQSLTADRNHIAQYIDMNSVVTSGDTTNEHRVYGKYIDIDVSGDSNRVYGSINDIKVTHNSGTITYIKGSYNVINAAHTDTATVLGINATEGQAIASGKSINTLRGGLFRAVTLASNNGDIEYSAGIHAEVEQNSDTNKIISASAVNASIDNNKTSDKITTGYLFHGYYEGNLPSTAYGIYIPTNVQNYFRGNVRAYEGFIANTPVNGYHFISNSFGMKRLTNQTGTLIRSDSIFAIHAGEENTIIDFLDNEYRPNATTANTLAEVTSEDCFVSADNNVWIIPNQQNNDRTVDHAFIFNWNYLKVPAQRLRLVHTNAILEFDSINGPDGYAEKRITCNDGGGNFNIRTGVYWNTANGQLQYTKKDNGGVHCKHNFENADGFYILEVFNKAANTDDPAIATNKFLLNNSKSSFMKRIQVGYEGDVSTNLNNDKSIILGQSNIGVTSNNGYIELVTNNNRVLKLNNTTVISIGINSYIPTSVTEDINVITIGRNAGQNIDNSGGDNDGKNNILIGHDSGKNITTGNENLFLGNYTGPNVTTGVKNTFIGNYSGWQTTTGNYNVCLGLNAGTKVDGDNNTFIGNYSGYSNTTGYANTFLGNYSGISNATGSVNTFIGNYSGFSNTTGRNNTFLGNYSGYSNATGSNNVFLGIDSGRSSTDKINRICIGYSSGYSYDPNSNSNVIIMGNNDITNAYIKVSWSVTSDKRDKTDIENVKYGLDFINKLNPVTFRYDDRTRYKDIKPDGSKKDVDKRIGVLAQDVLEEELKIENKPLIVDNNNEKLLTVKETALIYPLINAVKELTAELNETKSKLASLEERLAKLENN